jgi:hypothetical protein
MDLHGFYNGSQNSRKSNLYTSAPKNVVEQNNIIKTFKETCPAFSVYSPFSAQSCKTKTIYNEHINKINKNHLERVKRSENKTYTPTYSNIFSTKVTIIKHLCIRVLVNIKELGVSILGKKKSNNITSVTNINSLEVPNNNLNNNFNKVIDYLDNLEKHLYKINNNSKMYSQGLIRIMKDIIHLYITNKELIHRLNSSIKVNANNTTKFSKLYNDIIEKCKEAIEESNFKNTVKPLNDDN